MNIPDKIEVVQFICSGCGDRSVSAVTNERMKCTKCKYEYRRRKDKEWVPAKHWKWMGD